MSQRTRVLLALGLAACCSAALGSTAARNFGPFGTAASVAGIVAANDGAHVVLANSSSGPVLLRIGADNTLLRAVHVKFVQGTSLAKIPSGFLIAGGGISDTPWVAKLNEQFEVDWAETFDGDFRPQAVSAANDGSIYLGGYRTGYSKTAALVRLTADGSILWRRTYHGSGHLDEITSIQPTKDGVVAAGSTGCGLSLWKVLADGTFSWQRCFGSGGVSRLMAVSSAGNEDIVAVGHDDAALIVIRTNSAGLFRWKVAMGAKGLADATDVVVTKDQVIVIGIAETVSNAANLIAVGLTFDGKRVWQKSYGSQEETSAIAFSHSFSYRNAAPDGGGGVVVGVGIGDSLRLLRFGRDGSLDDGCSRVADSALSYFALPPVGESIAVETRDFDASAHRVQTVIAATTVSSSAPACSTPPAAAVTSASKPPQVEQPNRRLIVLKQTSDLLIARKFAELDALADEWRRTHARVEPLSPKLLLLYEAVAGDAVGAQVGEEAQEKLLKDWIASRPSSPTAVLALGRYYVNEAGAKRGSGTTVSEKGSEEMERYMAAALQVLREHQQLAAVDPQYYSILISATQDGSQYFQLGPAAQADSDVIGAAAIFLLPQWGGTVEQYQRFMDIAVARTKDDLGDTMYARLAWRLVMMACCDDKSKLWDTYHLDWARTKQGFLDWSARMEGPELFHRLAYFAYIMKNRAVVAEMLSRRDVTWDASAATQWPSQSVFDAARAWAFPKVSSLGSPAGPQAWPQVVLDSDITLTNGEHRRAWGFLAHGPDGVVAVSSVASFYLPDAPGRTNATAQNQITSWKLIVPTEPKHDVTVTAYVTPVTSLSRAIVLSLPPVKGGPILRPLDIADALPELQSKVFVVGCPRSEATCKQHIYEGKVTGGGSGNDANGHLATTGIDFFVDGISGADLIGAPVVDEGGFVVGVVVGNGPKYYGKQSIQSEGVPFLVRGH